MGAFATTSSIPTGARIPMSHLTILNYGYIRATEDGRYSVYDTIEVLAGKKNPRDAWKRLCNKHSEILFKCQNFQFSGRGQSLTPVASLDTCLEILHLIGTAEILLADWKTSDRFYPRTEAQIVRVLKAAFSDCEPCTQFYVDGYRIDLYLAKQRIAIECDEEGHSHYSQKREKKREKSIKSALGCSFIRFNPYDPSFNLGDVIIQIRQLIESCQKTDNF